MTARTIGKVIFAALVVLLIIFAGEVVLLLFAAILLAVLLRALSELLAKYARISPLWALAIVVVLLALSFAVIGWLIAPSIGEQVRELRSALPAALQRLQLELNRFAWLETLLDSAPRTDALIAQPGVAGKVTGAVSGTLAARANIVLVVVIALYLAADPRPYVEGTVRLFPMGQRDRAREVLHHRAPHGRAAAGAGTDGAGRCRAAVRLAGTAAGSARHRCITGAGANGLPGRHARRAQGALSDA